MPSRKENRHGRLSTIILLKNSKIVEKQLCKLNCSYGKVSHSLKKEK